MNCTQVLHTGHIGMAHRHGTEASLILFLFVQAVQDVQGPEVHLHADGGQPGRGAVDHPQG